MNILCDTANIRPTTVSFVNLFDASLFGRTVHMTAHEERRLRNVLAALNDYGFLLRASLEPALPDYGFADVIDHLRATIGSPIADAALAAAERFVPAIEPPPSALIPVWEFDPEPDSGSEDLLLSSGLLWNVNLLIEALRVEGDENPVPVAAVRERFSRWVAAAGSDAPLATSRLPGYDGSYVIFAAAAPV